MMMDFTPRLNLPYIAPQQAQKQVTYNEAMQALDLLVQPAVRSRTVSAPPGSPADGDAYIVPAGASGTWAGHAGTLAVFIDGGWMFRSAADGWLAYVADAAEIAICQGGVWTPMVTSGGTSVAKWGVNAAADLTSRFSVAADASLFSHDGTDHRLKLNKAAAGNTASVVLQSGFSGRAELGLTGDDDVHVKVSADGSTWSEAIRISRASGLVTLAKGQLAFPATQNPSSDANTLDDYEEGTWSPTDASGAGLTLSSVAGTYTKVGREVTIRAAFSYPATGSGALARIGGLPFTPGSGEGGRAGSLSYTNGSVAARWQTDNGAASGYFYSAAGGTVSNAQMSGTLNYIQATYPAA